MVGYEDSELQLIPFYICAIFATILIAYIKIFIKSISQKESNIKIQFYFSINSLLIVFIPYLIFSSQILIKDLFLIFLISIFGLLAQYFTIKGLKDSEAIKVMPFDYSRILFATIIGVSFFNEKITEGMIFGSLVIVFSGIKLITSKPNKLNK